MRDRTNDENYAAPKSRIGTREEPYRRTVREFQSDRPVFEIAQAWAEAARFRVVERGESRVIYEKGSGLIVPPARVEIELDQRWRLSAFLRVPAWHRAIVLFMWPREMGVGSGSMLGALPRRRLRLLVNRLLRDLDQPEIE